MGLLLLNETSRLSERNRCSGFARTKLVSRELVRRFGAAGRPRGVNYNMQL